jgi:protein SCO1/2
MEMNKILVLGLLLIPVLVGCRSNKKEDKLPILGRHDYVENTVNGKTVIDTIYHIIPDFEFINQDNIIVTHATFENAIYVADFFFTSCPTICPIMKTQMLRVNEAIQAYDDVKILSHTIDPEYDTVTLLKDYSERLGVKGNKWHFVTGNKEDIYEIGQRSYMVTAGEDGNAPGGYIHSGAFILIDKDKRVRGMYDGTKPEKVDLLIRDIATLRREYSGG